MHRNSPKLFRGTVFVFSLILSLLGCKKKTAPPAPRPSVSDLKFPVILVFGESSVRVERDASGLQSMHSNYVNLHHEEKKWLIDSDSKIYSLTNLHSTRTGLGQMMNPSGSTPVAFDLDVAGNGLEQAKSIITACKWLGSDADTREQLREAIQKAGNVAEIVNFLQPNEVPSTAPTM